MKTLLATTAMAALLSAHALAQEPAQPAPAEPPAATEPLPEEQAPSAAEPAPEGEMGTEGTAETETDDAVTGSVAFIEQQGDEEMLASDWIGASVYGTGDEDLGDISDLVVAEDGSITGVVLGVGGFLGIGAKSVAVPFDAIQVGADPESGDTTLHLAVARDQLETAPDFMTLEDIQAAEDAAQQESMQPDTGLGATPPAQ